MADVSLNSTSDSGFQLNISVEEDISINSSQSISPAPRYVKLKDDEFIEAAGLERTCNSARKSSMEKLLEQSLNTLETSPSSSPTPRSPKLQNSSFQHIQSSDSENDGSPHPRRGGAPSNRPQNLKDDQFLADAGLNRTGTVPKKSSKEKLLEQSLNTMEVSLGFSPSPRSAREQNTSFQSIQSSDSENDEALRRRRITPTNHPQNLKDDQFLVDAGLNRTGVVARKSSREKLLEEQLNTAEPTAETPRTRRATTLPRRNSGSTPTFKRSDSVSSNDSDKRRRGSVYEQKEIEAPKALVGNRIASRTQNLFKQYERDMTVHEPKPLNVLDEMDGNIGIGQRKASYSQSTGELSKVDAVRMQKEEELLQIKQQYRQRLIDEEKEEAERKRLQREKTERKYSLRAGDANAKDFTAENKNFDNKKSHDCEDERELLDQHGNKIERSGGKENVLTSTESVTDIRHRIGSIGKSDWRKMHTSAENDSIVSNKVKSARNMFKEIESKKENLQKYNRPTSRKVRDPKEIMERRKKMTYGNDNEELPQDGVIKKSVIIEETEMGNKKNALNVYKTLENRNDTYLPSEKPTNRLLTDEEARVAMNGKKMSTSTTTSEGSEDLTIEIHGDVSGYGSANTPCSPLSVVSDDYTCLPDAPDETLLKGISDLSMSKDISVSGDDNSNCNFDINAADVRSYEREYQNVEYM